MNYVYTKHARERLEQRFPGLPEDAVTRARPRLITSQSVLFTCPETGAEFVCRYDKWGRQYVVITVQPAGFLSRFRKYRKREAKTYGRGEYRRQRRWDCE